MKINAFSFSIVCLTAWWLAGSALAQTNLPPAITNQPVSQTNEAGASATFSVVAAGNAPLAYQWQFNGTNLVDGGGVSGSATANLELNPLTAYSAGNYALVVTNTWGSVTSIVATLTIVDSPAITRTPGSQGSPIGGSVEFAVSALGQPPLYYQWQFNGVNLTNGPTLSGATSNNLVLTQIAANNAGSYTVIVTNAWGSVTSSVIPLVIDTAPFIITQPAGTNVVPGQNAYLTVMAGGTTPLAYQWQYNGSNITNARMAQAARTPELFFDPVAATNGGNYDVIITNLWGSVTSSVVTLTVNSPPVITNQPVSLVLTNATSATFSVGATGTGRLTYQWLLNGKSITNNLISTVAGFTGVGSSGQGYSGDGGPATNALLNHPTGLALDGDGNLFIADSGNERIRKVNASGTITTPAGNGNTGFNGNGLVATNASLYLSSAVPYSGVAVDADDNLFITDTANTRLRLDAYDTLITVAGTGGYGYAGDGGPGYNAELNRPSGVAVDAAGNIYFSDSYNYRVRKVDVNDLITTVAGRGTEGYAGDGGAATNASLSNPAGLAVDAAGNLFIADSFNNRIRKVSTNGIITTVAGNGSDGYNGDGIAATNAWLAQPAGVAVDSYGDLLIADTENSRIRMITPLGSITTVAGRFGTGNSGDGGAATNAYLYFPTDVALDASGDMFIADTDNNRIRKVTPQGPVLTVLNLGTNNSGNYQVIVSSAYGSVTSSIATLTLDLSPAITQPPASQTSVNGSSATFEVTATGTAPLAYQWEFNGTPLAGQQNDPALNLGDVSAANAGNYQVVITNLYGSVTSSVAVLTVTYPPAITNQPLSQTIVIGSNALFNVAATGTAPLNYQWQFNGINLTDGGNLSGSATPNLQLTQVAGANAGSYAVIITNAWGSVTSSVVVLTVVYPPAITSPPAGQLIENGSNALFSVTATGTGPLNYQWQFNGTSLTDGGNLSGSATTNLSLTPVTATNAGLYDVVIANAWGSVTSSVAVLTVVYPPAITNQPLSQSVIAVNSNSATFTVTATGTAPLAYQWQFDGTNLTDGGNVSGSASPILLVGPVTAASAGTYAVLITNAWGSVTSSVATLTVLFPPAITNQPQSASAPPGGSVTFTVGATGTPALAYQWQLNGSNLPNNLISSVAGNGKAGFSGDGGTATNAVLNYPYAVAVDGSGNQYVVDHDNQRVRKVNVHGLITTVAGNGTAAFAGDGLAATNGSLDYPNGVAVDSAGNLYIADTSNQRIRKVNTSGIITTVAGNGTEGYSGDGGAATNASLDFPYAVAVDGSNNVYVADRFNDRVRMVSAGGIITTVAGTGSAGYSGDGGAATNAQLNSPTGLAVDAGGNLWIADIANHRVRQVDAQGIITTVAGNGTLGFAGDGGAATNASVAGPESVSVDGLGNVFIADTTSQRIRKVDAGGRISTVAGNGTAGYSGDGGPATIANLDYPYGVATDASGNLYIADTLNERVREMVLEGPALTVANVSVTNAGNYQVVVTNLYGSVTSSVAALTLLVPPAISQQPVNQSAVIGHNVTFTVTATGASPLYYQWQFNGTNITDKYSFPGANTPTLTVVDTTAASAGYYDVLITNALGSVISSVVTLTITYPPAITVQPSSQVVSNGNSATFNVSVTGTGPFTYQWQLNGTNLPASFITTVAGKNGAAFGGDGGLATNASLNYPYGVAADGAGNIYIADDINQRIRKVNTNGLITTVAGNGNEGYAGDGLVATNSSLYLGGLYYEPCGGVAVNADGNVLIADTYNNRVRLVTYGLLVTVAGPATTQPVAPNYNGDGGPAYNASLGHPLAVALDPDGNIYIADTISNRIRKVDVNDNITTLAGNGTNGYSGDGGAATNARLSQPSGVAADAFGNVFIADNDNQRIRRVDVNGIITTVAGNGVKGYSGDGGTATNASLNYPYGVAVDAYGDLFIADTDNQRIRMVNPGGIITTVAGQGRATYAGDGGMATSASLNQPAGVAVDAIGNMYIADTYNQRIRKVTPQGPVLAVANAGIGNAGSYQVIITSASGSVTSSVATLTVEVGPVITQPPVSLGIVSGGNATFTVTATGTSPLAYQWSFNGASLNDRNNQSLLLNGVTPGNAGPYQVLVTNLYGSVTSSVATLTVGQPQISGVTGGNGGVTLSLLTGANASSRLLATTNLAPPVVWLPVATNVPGINGLWQYTDTNAWPEIYYRTVTP